MIPAAFEYARAESVDHAIELLGGADDAKILAGGHSLLPSDEDAAGAAVDCSSTSRASATCRTSARTATRSRSAR